MTWDEFVHIADAEGAEHYELHDGEFVVMPPARPYHSFIQGILSQWLATVGQGFAMSELPYRPAKNLQFWYADVGYVSKEFSLKMQTDEYLIFSPLLIIEVLSASNRVKKIERQRVAAFSCDTKEFWAIDADAKTIEVWVPGLQARLFTSDEVIDLAAIPGIAFPVNTLFQC